MVVAEEVRGRLRLDFGKLDDLLLLRGASAIDLSRRPDHPDSQIAPGVKDMK